MRLLELPENVRGLLTPVARDIAERLDFSRATRVNRSFVPDDLHKQEAELLYRVPFREGGNAGEVLVYVLLEHQSRPDRTMGLRLLSYMTQLWDTQRRAYLDAQTPAGQWRLFPVVPVVFYTGRRRGAKLPGLDALMDVPDALAPFVPVHRTLFLSLQGTSPDALTGSAVAWAMRALQTADAPPDALAAVLRQAVVYLESLPDAQQAEWRRAMRYLLLLIRHKCAPGERAALYNVVTESVEERHAREVNTLAKTDAQVLMDRGRRQGRREGRVEGRRELLLEQLEFKFGLVSEETRATVEALSEARLNEVGRRLLSAASLAEVGL